MINQKRLKKLADELHKLGLDAIYLGPSTDLEYISGLDTHPDERVRGLMVSKDARCFSMTPLLYKEEMVKAFGDVPFYAEWNVAGRQGRVRNWSWAAQVMDQRDTGQAFGGEFQTAQ